MSKRSAPHVDGGDDLGTDVAVFKRVEVLHMSLCVVRWGRRGDTGKRRTGIVRGAHEQLGVNACMGNMQNT